MIKNLQLNNGWMYLPFKMLGEVRFVLSIYEQLMIKKKTVTLGNKASRII